MSNYENKNKNANSLRINDKEWDDYSILVCCEKNCEFYNTCYGNHSVCSKEKIVNNFQKELTDREQMVLKLKYGYKCEPKGWNDISDKVGISANYLKGNVFKNIKTKISSMKVRFQNGGNFFWFDILSCKNDNFFSRIFKEFYINGNLKNISNEDNDEQLEDLLLEVDMGIDYSIINREKSANKNISRIKSELNSLVSEFEELKPYLSILKQRKIDTLNQLLCVSYFELLEMFNNDDYKVYELENNLDKFGYKFRRTSVNKISILGYYYRKIDDLCLFPAVIEKELKETSLPVQIVFELYKHDIKTFKELLNHRHEYCFAFNFKLYDENLQQEEFSKIIEQFIKDSGVIVDLPDVYVENEIFTENKKMKIFHNMIDVFHEHHYSLHQLFDDVEVMSIKSTEAKFDYIEKMFTGVTALQVFQPSIYSLKMKECQSLLETSIDDADFNIRIYNVLKRNGVSTIGDLVKKSFSQINGFWHMGRRYAIEIFDFLKKIGLSDDFESFQVSVDEENLLQSSVRVLEISIISINFLTKNGINTIGDLTNKTHSEIMDVLHIYENGYIEILNELKFLKLSLKVD